MTEVAKLLGLWREQTEVLSTCFVVRLDQAADEIEAAIGADAKAGRTGQLGMSARARDLIEATVGVSPAMAQCLARDALVEAWKGGHAVGQDAPVECVGQLQRDVATRRIAELEAAVELLQGGEGGCPSEILTAAGDLRGLGCEGSGAADVMGSAVALLQRRSEEVVTLVAAGDTLRAQRTRLRERLVEVSDRAEDLQRQIGKASRREAQLRSQSEAWQARSETRESEALELQARAEAAEALAASMSDAMTVPSLREVSEGAQSELRRMTEEASGTRVATLEAEMIDVRRDLEAVTRRYKSLRGIHRGMMETIAQAMQRVG